MKIKTSLLFKKIWLLTHSKKQKKNERMWKMLYFID